MRQTIHQDVRDYMVAFEQKVKRAYTLAERGVPLMQEHLIRMFMDGITSRDTHVKVHATHPASLEASYTAAVTADKAEQLAGLGRHEEPMEIGETKTGTKKAESI